MAAEENRRVSIFINGKEVEFSLKGISAEMRKMRNELRSMTIGTDEYKKKSKELEKVEAMYQKHASAMKSVNTQGGFMKQAFSGIKSSLSALISPAGLVTAGIGAVIGIFMSGVQKMREFESALDNLSARTGFTGKDIDTLKGKAIEMSRAFGIAPKAIVDAFAEAASARPELMNSADALAAFTGQAITLSKITKTDLQQNIADLTTIMNTNNIETKDTAKTVEILVGAAQKGAKEIPFLSTAMQKIGGTAANANVGLAQQAAVIELLGEKYSNSAETVGTNTRNILIQLQKDWDAAKDGPFDLTKALDQLAPSVYNVSEMTDRFGKENVVAAQTLVQHRDRLSELTSEIGNFNGANEVARTQSDNLDGAINQLSARWDALWADMSDGNGVITWLVRSFDGLLYAIQVTSTAVREAFTSNEQLAQEAAERGRSSAQKAETRRIQIAVEKGTSGDLLAKAEEQLKLLNKESEQYARTLAFVDELKKAINDKAIREQQIEQKKRLEAETAAKEAAKRAQEAAEDAVKRQKEATKAENAFDSIGELTLKGYDNELSMTATVEAEKNAIKISSAKSFAQFEEDLRKARFEKEQQESIRHEEELKKAKESITNSVINTATQLFNISSDKRKNRELDNLEKTKAAGRISEEKYEAQKEKIEREAFARRKRLNIAEVTINALVAASKTLAQFGMTPASIPALVALGAQTAGQIAVIAAQEYGEGGLVYGPSHARGGVPAVMEGGEYVVRKKYVTPETLPFLEQMNQGRIVYMNMPAAVENTRQDTSGILSNRRSEAAAASSMDEIRGLRNDMREWQTQLEVNLPLRKFEKATDRKSRVEKLANVA